jgi:hypothetical protein
MKDNWHDTHILDIWRGFSRSWARVQLILHRLVSDSYRLISVSVHGLMHVFISLLGDYWIGGNMVA